MPRLPRPPRSWVGRALAASGRGLTRLTKGAAAHPFVLLWALALLLLVVTWSTTTVTHDVPDSLLPVLALMTVAPLVVLAAGQRAIAAWVVSMAASLVWLVVPGHADWPMPWPVTHFLVLLLTVLVVALAGAAREVALATVVTALLFLVVMDTGLKPWAIGVVVIVAFGLLVRWLVLSRRQIARQEEEAEVERARRAVVEERSRIARELHDVVAHHMSMVVVQAQTAPYRVPGLTPEAKGELAGIEESARAALQEVRSVLGVLREEGTPAATAPQPTLADLPALLESSRAAGMDLTWHLGVDPERCPPGTGLALHRVLQEALANASRHSPGSSVRVELLPVHAEDSPRAALLTVGTSPSSGAARPVTEQGGGHGIPGMRTRVEAVGGVLTAGPTPEGGFVVTAQVPLDDRPGLGG